MITSRSNNNKRQTKTDLLHDELRPYVTAAKIIQIICFVGLALSVFIGIWYSVGFGVRLAISVFVLHNLTNGALAWINAKLQIEIYGEVKETSLRTSLHTKRD